MQEHHQIIQEISSLLWGLPTIFLLVGAGLVWISDYLTIWLAENKILEMSEREQDISFHPSFSPVYSLPGFTLQINF